MLLSNTIYNCPAASTQQGTHESILCARPSWKAYQVSSWSEMSDYYDPADVIRAAGMMVDAAERFRGNNNLNTIWWTLFGRLLLKRPSDVSGAG